MTLIPCQFLDYGADKYGPDITLETCAPHYPNVRFWRLGPTWTSEKPGTDPGASKVQFCTKRGRIPGIFGCYNGEMSCYAPAETP